MSHLLHLRTFLETYRTQSLTKAANRLNITQPAASAHIQALESFVGKALFIRQARGVKPTVAADELACCIAPSLDTLETKISAIKKSSSSLEGPLHIAAPAEFLGEYIPHVIAPLVENGINLRFHVGDREQIYHNLEQGNVDLAITASLPDRQLYDFIQIATERLILVVAPRLAQQIKQSPVSLSGLENLPLIAYSENLPLIKTLFGEEMYRQASITVADLRVVKNLVCAGQGWSVLPDYLCRRELASGALIQLTTQRQTAENQFYLVWNKGSLRQPRILFVRDYLAQWDYRA